MINNTANIKYNSGFTLIEMIVTVAIVAILASIAVPSFSSLIERNRATVAANEMVSALLLARSEALKRRNNVTVCTSVDQTTCAGNGELDFSKGWIVFVDCDKDRVRGAAVDCGNGGLEAETVLKAQLGGKGMNVNKGGDTAKAHYFTYNFTGRTDISATFTVTKESSSTTLKEVVVSLTGRVRTCDGVCP
jgi:type IV fimbrial biogenesis protein FimT